MEEIAIKDYPHIHGRARLPSGAPGKSESVTARPGVHLDIISSALGQVSTIGQVRQVSFDAEGLDADARDVTVVDDGNCCLLLSARTPRTNRLY